MGPLIKNLEFGISYLEKDVVCLKQPYLTHDKLVNLIELNFFAVQQISSEGNLWYMQNISVSIFWSKLRVYIYLNAMTFSLGTMVLPNLIFFNLGETSPLFFRIRSSRNFVKSDSRLFTCANEQNFGQHT